MTSNGYTLAHPADLDGETSYTFTCGKIDAGIAVLIGSRAHLIEFPSLLLPPGCEPGSIVSITCARDQEAEKVQAESFWDLQNKIHTEFGLKTPETPILRLRSVTQTSVTLEWDKLDLAQSKLLSLAIWKNGQRLGAITNPNSSTSTKLSGLDLDTEYSFHLVMKTTGGIFNSKTIKVKTHSLDDTSGINVCFGVVLPQDTLEQARLAVEKLNARWTEKIQIDTTHFVCTMPHNPQQNTDKSTQPNSFPSLEYQRALQLSIPIVQPTWLLACLTERKMVPIAAHYLGAQPPNLSSISSSSSIASASSRRFSKVSAHQGTGSESERLPRQSGSTPSSPSAPRTSKENTGRSRAGTTTSTVISSQADTPRLPSTEPGVSSLPVITESSDPSDRPVSGQQTRGVNGNEEHDAKHTKDTMANFRIDPFRSSISTNAIDSMEQPSIPPARQSGISDILNEIVDAPENDGYDPAISSLQETKKTTAVATESQNKPEDLRSDGVFLTPSKKNSEIIKQQNGSDDLEDDPFSATSPTVSHLYLDEVPGHPQLNILPATPSPATFKQTDVPSSPLAASFATIDFKAKEPSSAADQNEEEVPTASELANKFGNFSMSGQISPKSVEFVGKDDEHEISLELPSKTSEEIPINSPHGDVGTSFQLSLS
ncbi:hypothetical protein BY996DRAFT_6408408 [Phakopsora pachyrhizi]|nr:hypothetical protein BY996DRAFT_6408408 [Phakopsora pachyrhizi]